MQASSADACTAVGELERLQWDGAAFTAAGIARARHAMATLARNSNAPLTLPQAAAVLSGTNRLLRALARPDAALRLGSLDALPLLACAALAAADGMLALRKWFMVCGAPPLPPQAAAAAPALAGDVASAAGDMAWGVLQQAAAAALQAPAVTVQALLLAAQLAAPRPAQPAAAAMAQWRELLQLLQAPALRQQLLCSSQQLQEVVSLLVAACPFTPSDDMLLRQTLLTILRLWVPAPPPAPAAATARAAVDYSSWSALCDGMGYAITSSPQRITAAVSVVLSQLAPPRAGDPAGGALAASAAVASAGLLRALHVAAKERGGLGAQATVALRTTAAALQRAAGAATAPNAAQPFAAGVALALTLAAPPLCGLHDLQLLSTDLSAAALALTDLLAAQALTITALDGAAPPAPLLFMAPHMCRAAAALLAAALPRARLAAVRRLSDCARGIAHLNALAARGGTGSGGGVAPVDATTNNARSAVAVLSAAVLDGLPALADALAALPAMSTGAGGSGDERVELWCELLELLSSMGAAPAAAPTATHRRMRCAVAPDDVLMRIAAVAEGLGAGVMCRLLAATPPCEPLLRPYAWAQLGAALQPVAHQPLLSTAAGAAAGAQASTGAFGADRAWPYVRLAERWVAQVGHLAQPFLVERVVPLLLACVRGGASSSGSGSGSRVACVLPATAASAHAALWTLISYPYILQGVPVPLSDASGHAADLQHEARHRLACAYFADALASSGDAGGDLGAVAAAVGLVVGGLGQVESDQGVALHCLALLRDGAVSAVRADPALRSPRTHTHVSLLFQMLKVAPPRLLPQAQSLVGAFVGDALTAVAGEPQASLLGSALFESVAHQCEPARRYALCAWYQRLAARAKL